MSKRWIVISGTNWDSPSVSSTRQYAECFYRDGWSLLWINPVPFKPAAVGVHSRAAVRRRILRRLMTQLRFVRRLRPRFFLLAPFFVPRYDEASRRLNRFLIRAQVVTALWLLRVRVKDTILWTSSLTAQAFQYLPFRTRVYEAADLISDFRTDDAHLRRRLAEEEEALCRGMDLVLTATEQIGEKLRALSDHPFIRTLHHGVDYELFSRPAFLAQAMQPVRAAGRPVAGYFGSLSDANDKEALQALADNGFEVALIGRPMGDYSALRRHPHVHVLGPVPQERLPDYAAGFDVGLLNWRSHPWIDNCFPIKALEYLALGLPVISCSIRVLREHFSKVVYFASTPAEFVAQARQALREDSTDMQARRRAAVEGRTWRRQYEQALGWIEEAARRRCSSPYGTSGE